MNTQQLTLLSFLSLTGLALWAEPAPTVSPTGSSDLLAEALPILQSNYADFKALNYKPGDRLTDLIARSNGKITLISPEVMGPVPIITAVLPDGIVYWRLASFTPKKNWDDLAGNLKWMIDYWHVFGAVLDLRSNATPNDYAGAAQVAGLFVPGDSTLWKYLPQKGDGILRFPSGIPDRQFQGPLIVLTNGQTTGAAEALAASLKADGALIVGRPTAGTAAFFEDDTLASGQVLRFAVAPPTQTDGTSIRAHAVTPDIVLDVDEHNENAALTLIRDNHISDVIEESAERHRLSEASLVKGEDPELDDYLVSLEKGPVLLSLPATHDPVLINALDSLRAIRLSERPAPAETTTANASASVTPSSVQ